MAKLALRSNRKFRRLLAMVRVDSPEHLRGHLSALWEATWENGTPLIGDLQDIEALAGWTMPDTLKYPPGALADGLVKARLVDVIVPGQLYAIHDWYEHAPAYVKQAISRRISGNRHTGQDGDPTIGPETYFLGLKAWQHRAAELGIDILAGEVDDDADPDLPPEPVENANGDRKSRRLDIRLPKPGDVSRFGDLSSLAETRQVKPSQDSISPPRSPSPLFSTGRRPADVDSALRAAMSRVTDAVVHLAATEVKADEESADRLEDQALDCRTLADWTALADLAKEALEQSATRMEVPA